MLVESVEEATAAKLATALVRCGTRIPPIANQFPKFDEQIQPLSIEGIDQLRESLSRAYGNEQIGD